MNEPLAPGTSSHCGRLTTGELEICAGLSSSSCSPSSDWSTPATARRDS